MFCLLAFNLPDPPNAMTQHYPLLQRLRGLPFKIPHSNKNAKIVSRKMGSDFVRPAQRQFGIFRGGAKNEAKFFSSLHIVPGRS